MTRRAHLAPAFLLLLAGVVALVLWSAPETQRTVHTAPAPKEPAPAPAAAAADDPWAAPADVPKPALRYERFETFTIAHGLPTNRVTTVLVEGETIWVGSDHGLCVREKGAKRWRFVAGKDELSHPYITSLAREPVSGDLWISTLAGLNRMSGGRFTAYTQTNSGLMNDVVYHVVAKDGLVLAATAAGASVFDVRAGTWALYDHENSIMHEPWCYAAAFGPGRMWIGIWGSGVVEREAATGRWREYRDPDGEMEIDLLKDDGPIHDVTSFIAYDAGVLWQATYFGLARYDGRRWRSFMKADTGLPGDFINHVASRGHTAWIASDEGLGVFDGNTCVTYKRAEGGGCMVTTWRDGKQVSQGSLPTAPAHDYILWAHGGEHDVWLATGQGLSHGMAAGYEGRDSEEDQDR